MSKANLALTENYYFNNMLARALVQLIPHQERVIMLKWFDKLNEMTKDGSELEMRKDYMLFILLMLQAHKMKEPFTDPPPDILVPLKKAVTRQNYEDVLLSNDEVLPPDENEEEPKTPKCPPSNFFALQPVPNEGVLIYTAVFSDQEKN